MARCSTPWPSSTKNALLAGSATQVAEFVHLHSRWRSVNRFQALVHIFDLLCEWQKQAAGLIADYSALRQWVTHTPHLSNPALRQEIEKTGDAQLQQALAWSEAINACMAQRLRHIPPFAHARENLLEVSKWADIMVCSTTNSKALHRDWQESGLAQYTRLLAGQEMGRKKDLIHAVLQNKYERSKVLMLGDALADLEAAHGNGVSFFPIIPNQEGESWRLFGLEAAARWRLGQYAGDYERELILDFTRRLPQRPPWRV
jgi:phosphoglycolate phosphatase-like HAD superfamily hydrolase